MGKCFRYVKIIIKSEQNNCRLDVIILPMVKYFDRFKPFSGWDYPAHYYILKRVDSMENIKLPVGIENFEEIRKSGYYYVDKTSLIEQLLTNGGMVSLFTRPRRFGKTLNMSMLRYFFEVGTDPSLFDGLQISANKQLCSEYMGQYPVIFISLKTVDGLSFENAYAMLRILLRTEMFRLSFLKDSPNIPEHEKLAFRRFLDEKDTPDDVQNSLRMLSSMLYRHFGKRAIILIDEYDVPLDKAFQNGYYNEMVSLIRSLMNSALKTNDALQFAVLTGCLRISKESIFTGLNNFKVLSIADSRFDEQFGFTEAEVKELLSFYQLESHMEEMKLWYDGYRFGNADIYCPWDVINHVDLLKTDPHAVPQSYWINSSGNGLVKRFIDKADKTTQREIERLIAGESIDKAVCLELTYDELDNSIDNLWSVLFTTGYLTQDGRAQDGIYKLKIPNEEVRDIFKQQIREWFKHIISQDTDRLRGLWRAFAAGDAQTVEDNLNILLGKTISVLDPKGDDYDKEKFYHAFLAGLLVGNGEWAVLSNRETGYGFADLMVETDNLNAGLVIELKISRSLSDLDQACKQAMLQIKTRQYDMYFRDEGRDDITAYGIAFYKKRCKVLAEKLDSYPGENC